MLFHFKKWFFDLNAGEETYIYFFIAEIKFFFFRKRNITFHHFNHHSGSSTKTKSVQLRIQKGDWEALRINGRNFSIVSGNNELNIISDLEDLNFHLKINNYQSGCFPDSLIINHKNKQIEWFPVRGFMSASGTIRIDENVLLIENASAYIDHVFSSILPFNVPILRMYWGRILHAEIRIAYSIILSAKGEQWARCFVIINDQLFNFTEIHYKKIKSVHEGSDDDQEDSTYQLICCEGLNRLNIKIDHLNIAAEGVFIDPDQYKYKSIYRLLNRISKNPRGKKYISIAEVLLDINDRQYQWEKLVCVDEYVLF